MHQRQFREFANEFLERGRFPKFGVLVHLIYDIRREIVGHA